MTDKQKPDNKRTFLISSRPRILSAKTVLIAVLILALCAGAWYGSLHYGIDRINAGADSAKQKLTRQNADAGKEIDLGDALREDTVSRVIETESIPAYSYDQCWSLDVSKPSGVTLADLKLVSRGAFVGIEDAFLKAEQDYGINCLFVMAIAAHESANGTICFRPNNMFGFGGRGFSSKSECVDVVARALQNNYLTPGASLYNGTRITDVNKRYAASSTWDNKVCRNMARYYSIIAPNHNAQLEKLK